MRTLENTRLQKRINNQGEDTLCLMYLVKNRWVVVRRFYLDDPIFEALKDLTACILGDKDYNTYLLPDYDSRQSDSPDDPLKPNTVSPFEAS